MVRRAGELPITLQPNLKGGRETVVIENFLLPEEMCGAGRLCGLSVIPVGGSIGRHTHEGDYEVYYMLEGRARASDNGTEVLLNPGDMLYCPEGHFHEIENIGDVELKYVAIILYTQNGR
jgi:mannose-6-phosphate isomerase-like protein (cupin superfamily)